MATAASVQAAFPVAAAASATAEPYMAFHSVRTLSSRPGRTLWPRASSRSCRPSSTEASPRSGAPTGRRRMVLPSKLPGGGDPEPGAHVAASAAVGWQPPPAGGSARRTASTTWSGVQT